MQSMQLQPIVYVTDMARSIEWYRSLLKVDPTAVSDHWTTFVVDGTTLALHHSDGSLPAGSVALSLVAPAPLEEAHALVAAASSIIEQPFGRSFMAIDPDGTEIQVNEHRV